MKWAAWFMTAALAVAAAAVEAPSAATDAKPFPVGEKLRYAVSWMGIRCGHLEIMSFVEGQGSTAPLYRIALLARTTKFFDGIYRVRTRLDSTFDPKRMTSLRYEEHSLEKKRRKDEVWAFDAAAGDVVRTRNGEATTIPAGADRAYDPLAFVYRLRALKTEVGDENVLSLMTSKGAIETVARTTEAKDVRTKMGRCDAVAVVPEPRDKMMFSKSGSMVVWIETGEARRPCRIEFDLAFGKLVASLMEVEAVDDAEAKATLESWRAVLDDGR